MTSTSVSPSAPASTLPDSPVIGAARRNLAADAATLLLVLMPLATWIANRSAPLMLGLCALALLGAAASEATLRRDLSRMGSALLSPLGLAALAWLGLALVSLAWSHKPARSLRLFVEMLVPLMAGLVVGLLWPARAPRWAWSGLAITMALACVFMMVELGTNMQLRRLLGLRPDTFIFNPMLIGFLLLGLALAARLFRSNHDRAGMVAGLAVAGVLVAAIGVSDSGAAAFGLGVGLIAWIAARFAPRLAPPLLAAGFLASLALAPVMGSVIERALPAAAHERLKGSHSRERVGIWLSFGEAARVRPLMGAGFGTSAVYDTSPIAASVREEHRPMLAVGHAHSLPLQLWAELGVPGVILAAIIGLGVMRRLLRVPERLRALPVAFAAVALAIATVGHGAWQAWWIAAIAVAIAWFRAGFAAEAADPPR
jgi:O-antigen ligase